MGLDNSRLIIPKHQIVRPNLRDVVSAETEKLKLEGQGSSEYGRLLASPLPNNFYTFDECADTNPTANSSRAEAKKINRTDASNEVLATQLYNAVLNSQVERIKELIEEAGAYVYFKTPNGVSIPGLLAFNSIKSHQSNTQVLDYLLTVYRSEDFTQDTVSVETSGIAKQYSPLELFLCSDNKDALAKILDRYKINPLDAAEQALTLFMNVNRDQSPSPSPKVLDYLFSSLDDEQASILIDKLSSTQYKAKQLFKQFARQGRSSRSQEDKNLLQAFSKLKGFSKWANSINFSQNRPNPLNLFAHAASSDVMNNDLALWAYENADPDTQASIRGNRDSYIARFYSRSSAGPTEIGDTEASLIDKLYPSNEIVEILKKDHFEKLNFLLSFIQRNGSENPRSQALVESLDSDTAFNEIFSIENHRVTLKKQMLNALLSTNNILLIEKVFKKIENQDLSRLDDSSKTKLYRQLIHVKDEAFAIEIFSHLGLAPIDAKTKLARDEQKANNLFGRLFGHKDEE